MLEQNIYMRDVIISASSQYIVHQEVFYTYYEKKTCKVSS